MEEILNAHGLQAVCVILSLHLFAKVGEFLWDIIKKKSEISDETVKRLTVSVQHLDNTMKEIKKDLAEIPKFKQDLRRLFTAVKLMAGEDWKDIRKAIMEDDISP